MRLILQVAGWACIAGSLLMAVRGHAIDRKLQAFRHSGTQASSYWFVPLRLRREPYTQLGRPLVGAAWSAIRMMYGLGVIGILMLLAARG